ncbi:translation initiation factor IF-6 [Candidatus Woesearchaeota archaeon]|jgi:translation initiation factor 6|nr:translation initiation factor IF-6 [Candidatus Woesearchaeota archaeon]MBT6041699.1 translation initiation factor IF-6 [Candidatus Woesearchaeota archaeon]MBT6337216.1 translation initiation factor IF-6 [Candidatus Woesearchaeota archaeon]MBT7928146.1 translation initiation factor IF-6 [Candidatus Woesearchaeota archaeon]
MHVLKTDCQSNPNVGLFGWANDKVCLVGYGFKNKVIKKIEDALSVPVYEITICGTDLVGVFCAGNNECLLVPSTVTEHEIKELDRICKEVDMKYEIVKSDLTALGNNILCTEIGALVNPEFSASIKKQIRQALRVNLNPGTIALFGIPGSLCVINKTDAIICVGVLDKEKDKLKELFGIEEFTEATVNFGSQSLGSGIISNSKGFIIGEMSSGVEITNIDEGLGFLGK